MKTVLSLGAVIALCAWTPDDDFDKATAKAAGMSKYAVKLTSKIEGMPGGGGGGGGGGAQPADVKVDKDVAAEIKSGEQTVYKKGDTLVYKDGETWKKYERQQGGGGGQGGNRATRGLRLLQGLKLPHEMLADFGKKMKEVKKADEKDNDCTVYSGDLTDEGAKELGALGGRGGGGGGQGGGFTFTGTAKFWVNAEGTIVKYEIFINGKGKIREQDVDLKSTRTYEISEIDNVKLEVPEEVTKILGGNP